MHKLIAILRDSYREATATWVIPAMAVLTLLLVALVASIGFKPVTLEGDLNGKVGLFGKLVGFDPNLGRPVLKIENVTVADPENYWKSDYSFDFVFETTKKAFERIENGNGNAAFPVTARRAANLLGAMAPYLENVRPAKAQPPAPDAAKLGDDGRYERRFRIETKGTKIKDPLSWPHQPSVLFAFDWFQTYSLREGTYTIEKRLINDVGSLAVLLVSIVITAGFIPNMLQKGAIDLMISKPIGRSELLVYKYLGGLIFVTILMTIMVGSIYVALGLRTGFWSPKFLLIIPLMTFYFAVLYAVSTLAAALTRSTLMAILATLVAWAVFFVIGWGYNTIAQADEQLAKVQDQARGDDSDPGDAAEVARSRRGGVREFNPVLVNIVNGLHAVSPRTYDLDDRMIEAIAQGVLTDFELKQNGLDKARPSWGATVGVSLAFIGLCLGLACWRVSTRDG